MRQFFNILIIFFLFDLSTYGQTDRAIVTFSQNKIWIDSLSKSTLDLQIEMIKQRLLGDTAVYYPGMSVSIGIMRDKIVNVPPNHVANLKLSDLVNDSFRINGFKGDSRLLYAIRYKDNTDKFDFIQIKRDSTTQISTIRKIIDNLSTDNVCNIEIIKSNDDKFALFGLSYSFGVIILELKDKRAYEYIDRLNK